jgi:two-component system, NtrC family, C4-dicarboxylate transport sensor histidine kinase DctB
MPHPERAIDPHHGGTDGARCSPGWCGRWPGLTARGLSGAACGRRLSMSERHEHRPGPRRRWARPGCPAGASSSSGAGAVAAAVTVWLLNDFLTENFTVDTRNRAETRLVLYSGNIQSEMQRTQVVPILLARDPALREALQSGNYATISQLLMAVQSEVGAGVDRTDGCHRPGRRRDRPQPAGRDAHPGRAFRRGAARQRHDLRGARARSGGYGFGFARAMRSGGQLLGVVTVEVDLAKFERAWAGFTDVVALTDSEGKIILSTEPRWRGRTEAEALALFDAPSALARALRATADWAGAAPTPSSATRPCCAPRSGCRSAAGGWCPTPATTGCAKA